MELLAIYWAIHQCRLYLQGHPQFTVITDHKPLLPIVNGTSLDAVENPRLQRILEKLTPYVFIRKWQKGKKHLIADALSRAPVMDPPLDEQETPVQIQHLIVRAVHTLVTDLPDPSLQTLNDAAKKDTIYGLIHAALLGQTPIRKLPLAHPARQFSKEWDRLSIMGHLIILDGHRVLVPTGSRRDLLQRLHTAHQGITRTKARARELYFWPGMSNDIVQTVQGCDLCQQYQPSQQREPLQQDPTPTWPFESASADIFEYGGHYFLVYVDRYSGWPLVDIYRKAPNTADITRTLCAFIAGHGVPSKLRTDGGLQFASQEFRDFCACLGITHMLSSAHYPQSNGHAEAAVKAMKNLVKKHWCNGKLDYYAFNLALLEWRNIPRDDGLSPASWLFGRPLRTSLPAIPRVSDRRPEGEGKRCSNMAKQEARYNERAQPLPPLKTGIKVRIQDHISKIWDRTGLIKDVRDNGRSYLIESQGRVLLRNRRRIRPFIESKKRVVEAPDMSGGPDLRRSKRMIERPAKYGQ